MDSVVHINDKATYLVELSLVGKRDHSENHGNQCTLAIGIIDVRDHQ